MPQNIGPFGKSDCQNGSPLSQNGLPKWQSQTQKRLPKWQSVFPKVTAKMAVRNPKIRRSNIKGRTQVLGQKSLTKRRTQKEGFLALQNVSFARLQAKTHSFSGSDGLMGGHRDSRILSRGHRDTKFLGEIESNLWEAEDVDPFDPMGQSFLSLT